MSKALADSFSEHAQKLKEGKRIWEPSGRTREGKLLWRTREAVADDIKRLRQESALYLAMQ